MKICILPFFAIIAAVFCIAVIYLNCNLFQADASTVNISAVVVSLCGNGSIDPGEQCDSPDLNGQTCQTLGFNSGSLGCSYCAFDTSGCNSAGPGGVFTFPQPPLTTVIFEGKSFPQAKVILLKDSQMVAETIARDDGNFQITLTGLSSGNYIFTAYSEDKDGIRTSLLTFPINVTFQATTKVSGIFVGPTIETDKEKVKFGESISIFGKSVPRANIRISIKSKDKESFSKIVADTQGEYNYILDTSSLEPGQYQVIAMAFLGDVSSNLSKTINFVVGSETVFKKPPAKCSSIGDLNEDCMVNLVDFSILIYWFERPNPPAGVDLNGDGKIYLIDFSIMAYYWTG